MNQGESPSLWTRPWLPAVALTVILAGALGLRLWNLGKLSLWFDEALSVNIATLPAHDIPIEVRVREQIPPLYHYTMHYWIERVGTTEFLVRLPSAFFGIGSILLIYHLGRALFGPWEGVIAALLLATSGFHLYYSQEARPYAMFLFMGLLSCYAFVQMLRDGTWRNQVGFVIATGLMLWCHLHSAFIVMIQQLVWLVVWWNRRGQGADHKVSFDRWLNLNTGALLIFFPWIPTVLLWLNKVSGSFWIPKMTAGFLPWIYTIYAGNAAVLVILLILGAYAVRKTTQRWTILFAWLLVLVPVVVPFVLSLVLRPLMVPRYGIMTTAGLALIAARGIVCIPQSSVRVGITAICGILSLLAIPRVFDNLDPKSDARGAAAYLLTRVHKEDLILLNAGFNGLVYRYYAQETPLDSIETHDTVSHIPRAGQIKSSQVWVWTEPSPYSNGIAHEQPAFERQGWKLEENIPFAGRISIQRYSHAAPPQSP